MSGPEKVLMHVTIAVLVATASYAICALRAVCRREHTDQAARVIQRLARSTHYHAPGWTRAQKAELIFLRLQRETPWVRRRRHWALAMIEEALVAPPGERLRATDNQRNTPSPELKQRNRCPHGT